jgi:type IV fimbrial biogenesis protein FimT
MRQPPPARRRRDGFTLIELMVGLTVLGVLLLVAAPGVRDMLAMQRLKSTHAQIVTDLQFARAEAVASGSEVNFYVMPQTAVRDACYIIFHHIGRNYGANGASGSCNCRLPAGSRCTEAGTRELRTVIIPRSRGVRVATPIDLPSPSMAFNPVNGAMVLVVNEAGLGSGVDFKVDSIVDAARSLRVVVGLSGRPTVCRPAGSTMPEPDC